MMIIKESFNFLQERMRRFSYTGSSLQTPSENKVLGGQHLPMPMIRILEQLAHLQNTGKKLSRDSSTNIKGYITTLSDSYEKLSKQVVSSLLAEGFIFIIPCNELVVWIGPGRRYSIMSYKGLAQTLS